MITSAKFEHYLPIVSLLRESMETLEHDDCRFKSDLLSNCHNSKIKDKAADATTPRGLTLISPTYKNQRRRVWIVPPTNPMSRSIDELFY